MAELSDDIRSFIQGGIDPVTFEEISDRPGNHRPWRRRTAARVASVAVLVAVAVPVVLALSSGRTMTTKAGHIDNGQARHRVITALDTTIASGSFDITFSQQPLTNATTTTTTTTPSCHLEGTSTLNPSKAWVQQAQTESHPSRVSSTTVPAPGSVTSPKSIVGAVRSQGPDTSVVCSESGGMGPGLAISGQGTIDTSPFAMVANTQVPGFGQITLRDDGTDVWELGGGDYGLSPGSDNSGPGSSLPGFAGLVEGTLGARQGAMDMMVLANPTGYLELDESAITNADQIGTGSVDGTAVTIYQVTLSPAQEATVTGTNTSEAKAIQDALTVLKAQGYTGTTVKISIDADGYIRQTDSTASFSDGASQSGVTTFSNFGCAGTVLMPGQQGASSPPAGCVSPDVGGTATTTTSTTAPSETTTAPPA